MFTEDELLVIYYVMLRTHPNTREKAKSTALKESILMKISEHIKAQRVEKGGGI